MAENVFDRDVTFLQEALSKCNKADQLEQTIKGAKEDIKKYDKMISQEEKNQADEISSVVKKRRNEITSTYDKELNQLNSRMKKADGRRENDKTKQQKVRFKDETADLRAQVESHVAEIRNVLKQDRICRICRTKLYYSLFLPKGVKDYLVLLLWILILILAIPVAICGIGQQTFLKQVQSKTVFYILIFAACICVTFLLYLLIASFTKMKYRNQLLHCRYEHEQIKQIKKQMKVVEKGIKKDKDESRYDLADHDEEIADLKQQFSEVADKKKQAVQEYEKTTRPALEQEIISRHEQMVAEYKEKQKEADKLQTDCEKEAASLRLELAEKYEAFLGKEWMKPENLQLLIDLMNQQGLATVADAIAAVKAGGQE